MKTLFHLSFPALRLGAVISASLGFALAGPALAETAHPPAKSADLFQTAKIWTVNLTFTPEQWAAIEPKGGPGGMGGPGGAGGPGGPGGPGRGGFDPSNMLVRGFLKGDLDGDGKLSKAEFTGLGEKWFALWDKEKTGKLEAAQLGAGLAGVLFGDGPGPMRGGPGGGGPGGGGPGGGGPGGRGPGGGGPGFGIKYPTVHADLEFEGQEFKDVAVRYKGNFTYMMSRNQLKRSLKIDLGTFSKGRKLAGVTKLNLHSNVTDPGWMNEELSYELFRDGGVPSPRTSYARVFFTVPGKMDHQYVGLYSLVEEIDKNFAADRFGTKKGAIFKPETRNLFADLGDDWSKYERGAEPKSDLSTEEQQRVIEFARFIAKADDAEFAAKLGDFLDIDEFARFMAVTVWLANLDSPLSMDHNYYVYLQPKTQRFQFLPWDLDLSFGKFNMGGGSTETLSIQKPWSGNNRFFDRVFKTDAFRQRYLGLLTEWSKTLFMPERFAQQVKELAAVIRPAVQEESPEKLVRFDKTVRGDTSNQASPAGGNVDGGPRRDGPGGPDGPGGGPGGPNGGFGGPGGPGGRGGPGGPGGPMSDKPIVPFVTARAQSVTDQLAGKAEEPRGEAGRPGGRGGPGGPGGFGPGRFFGEALLAALDTNEDGVVTHEEFQQGFARWFEQWNTDQSGLLTEDQLRAGLRKDFAPPRNGPPGAGGPPPPGFAAGNGGGAPPSTQGGLPPPAAPLPAVANP